MSRALLLFLAVGLGACAERPAAHQTQQAPTSPAREAAIARFSSVLGGLPTLESPGMRRAVVTFPARATEPVEVRDVASSVAIRVVLDGARNVALSTDGSVAVAEGALGERGDVLYRAGAVGMEDFVMFPTRPARESARYRVDVPDTLGLRLVGSTLEFVDGDGTPRLRVASPWIADAHGVRKDVDLSVVGCAVDRDPSPPWGRPTTPPGASSCAIELRWDGRDVAYPAVLDPAWTTTTGLLASDHSFGGGFWGMDILTTGLALIAGGYGGLRVAELFDPKTETWAATGSMPVDMGFTSMTAMPQGRAFNAVDGAAALYDVATGAWTQATPVTNDIMLVVAMLDGRVFAVGSRTSQIFDPGTGAFTARPDIPNAKGSHCGARLPDGKILIAGGSGGKADIFDPSANAWVAEVPPMSTDRGVHTCAVIADGSVVVVGGDLGGDEVLTSERFDPVARRWLPPAILAAPRHYHATSALGTGVLVTGGDFGVVDNSTELFDPALAKWLPTGNMVSARALHGQVLLPSGDVLVAGGYGNGSSIPKSSEIFRQSTPGSSCTYDGTCTTKHCVDGVCCDQSCEAACYACSAAKKGGGADGVCGPVAAGPEPSNRCRVLPAATCATNGLCNGGGACALYPKDTVCAPLACSAGALSESSCDGDGVCVPKTTSCNGFKCASVTSCGAGPCSGDGDCAPNFTCEAGSCVVRKPACDGDHTLVGKDGEHQDCAPYRCDGTACLTRCNSTTQCAGGSVCNRNGACVTHDDAVGDGDTPLLGCTIGRASRPTAAFVTAFALAGAFVRRRRSRR